MKIIVPKPIGFTLKFIQMANDKEKYNREWDGDYNKWLELGGKFKYYNTMKARDIFKQIAEAAWMCGDPGIWFVDTAQRETFGTYINEKLKPTGVNPCGEQGLRNIRSLHCLQQGVEGNILKSQPGPFLQGVEIGLREKGFIGLLGPDIDGSHNPFLYGEWTENINRWCFLAGTGALGIFILSIKSERSLQDTIEVLPAPVLSSPTVRIWPVP